MENTMIKLIATDIDGTLLHSDHTPPQELPYILQILNENNILFSLASGRPYITLLHTLDIDTSDLLFISENGAHVVYKNKALTIHQLNSDTVSELVAITRNIPKAYSVLSTPEGAFVENDDPDFIAELEKYYFKYTIVPDLTKIQCDVVKYTICDLAGAEQNSYPHFNKYNDNLQISIAGFVWLDMMMKGVNKGNAIQEIQATLGISEKETMVFGDYLNDLEMMKSAYYSYAMDNAHSELFETARYRAPSNDEDGVILKIKEMLSNGFIPLEE
jgi:Cof subfamily protein (haloacid dehalogenase superfamily)